MKPLMLTVAACALLASSATAGESNPDLIVIQQKLGTIEEAVAAQKPTARLLDEVTDDIQYWDEVTQKRRELLLAAMEDLKVRARARYLDVMDVLTLRTRVVDAKLDGYLDEFIAEARERNATREEFEQVLELLEMRRSIATTPPDLAAMVDEQVELMKKRFRDATPVDPTQAALLADEITRVSLDRALGWLVYQADKRHVTREQFLLVKERLERRARIWSEDREVREHVAFMQDQIDRLMDRAMQCDLTEEEIVALRDGLLRRARAATAGL